MEKFTKLWEQLNNLSSIARQLSPKVITKQSIEIFNNKYKAATRQLLLRDHPDKNGGRNGSEAFLLEMRARAIHSELVRHMKNTPLPEAVAHEPADPNNSDSTLSQMATRLNDGRHWKKNERYRKTFQSESSNDSHMSGGKRKEPFSTTQSSKRQKVEENKDYHYRKFKKVMLESPICVEILLSNEGITANKIQHMFLERCEAMTMDENDQRLKTLYLKNDSPPRLEWWKKFILPGFAILRQAIVESERPSKITNTDVETVISNVDVNCKCAKSAKCLCKQLAFYKAKHDYLKLLANKN